MIGSGIGSDEIIQTVAHKRWTADQKLSIVEESMQPCNSVARVARQHGFAPALFYRWRKLMLEGGATAVEADNQVVSIEEVAAWKKRIAELERALRKTLENDILKAWNTPLIWIAIRKRLF